MDRLFLDANVVIDLLGEREPYYQSAAIIATQADEGKLQIIVSALTFSTTFYILAKFEKKKDVKEKMRKFKVIAETANLTDMIIDKGLSSSFSDFEDSLQYYSAIAKGCHIFITRNAKDFKFADIPVLSPDEYLTSIR